MNKNEKNQPKSQNFTQEAFKQLTNMYMKRKRIPKVQRDKILRSMGE